MSKNNITKKKTFMDDEFYSRPMVKQKELADWWDVSEPTITKMVREGILEPNSLKRIPMYQIMEYEGLGIGVKNEISMRSILREKIELEKENDKLKKVIDSIKIELQIM